MVEATRGSVSKGDSCQGGKKGEGLEEREWASDGVTVRAERSGGDTKLVFDPEAGSNG